MSWFGGQDPAAELDAKIDEATSEAIPNGELDIAVGLEITDIIRSKKVPPKTAMRCLKKRLTKVHANPNLLGSTLKLVDLCVKNGGSHFLLEINSKEFVDYLVDYIFKVHYDVKNYNVYSSEAKFSIGNQILKLVREWSLYFKAQDGNYLDSVYHSLLNQGYDFPQVDNVIAQNASNFVDSKAPPDWIDGKECMICYTPFSVMNRKHHCRACGGVFCQTHSSNNIPLVSLGILQPVRVCDDCHQIHTAKNLAAKPDRAGHQRSRSLNQQPDDEAEQIRKAIELSLQSSQPTSFAVERQPSYSAPLGPPPGASDPAEEEMDDDLKAAIAASLAEYKQQEQLQKQHTLYAQPEEPLFAQQYEAPKYGSPPAEPKLEFYLNLELFDTNAYTSPQYSQPQQFQYQGLQFQSQPQQYQSQQPQQYQGQQPQQYQTGQQPFQRPPQGPPNVGPAEHIEQHKQKIEDLTPQDEEDINLFIQLMNGIRNDRSRQDPDFASRILNDQNLQDLHTKIARLKPKLNRSLRSSIEKYEFFLEMNNKINTITRLYDQFLENKLNQAMGKHFTGPSYGYGQQYPGQSPLQQQPTLSHQPTAQQPALSQQATALSPPQLLMQQQHSSNPYAPSEPRTQYGQVNESSQVPTALQSAQPTAPQYHQSTGNAYGGRRGSQYAAQQPANAPSSPQHTGHSQTTPYPYSMDAADYFRGQNVPSEPDFGSYENKAEAEPAPPVPTEPVSYQHTFNSYPTEEFSRPQFTGSYPAEPSSPPDVSEPSDADSVASRYPPVEPEYDEDPKSTVATTQEHASMRYPAVDDLEEEESLPSLTKTYTSESRKYEPEPLIEL